MKKAQLFIFFFLLAVFASYSQQRSEADAMKIADSFLKKSALNLRAGSSTQTSVSLSYKCTDNTSLRSTNSNVYYYVFNVNTDKGFVIVSGDERAKDVLGYSENGGFDIENISPNFRYWLSCYQEELEMLAKQPLDAVPTFAEVVNIQTDAAPKAFSSSVSPLLGGIKWDQGGPYNTLCPIDKTTSEQAVTGCVATGMAQVMMYYKWPVTGTGSYSYQSSTTVDSDITADFGATTYDWANMLDAYTESASETQKNAVATLMHHCGVAVDMTYTSGESGANSYSIPNALATYFGYDPNMKVYIRESYTKAQWSDLIKEELSASRPVLYSGRSDGGGHLFVCDGYDSNNKFHFNWGWSGSSDGYYEITALNPSALGIGGGTGGGFNSSQGIFTGIQKPTGAPDTSSYEIVAKGILTVKETEITRDGTFTINAGSTFGNYGAKSFNDYMLVLLTTETGKLVDIIANFGKLSISPGVYYSLNALSNMDIDANVENGNYRIYFGYYDSVLDDFLIAQTRNAAPSYVNVTVADDKITFSSPTEGLPILAVNSIEVLNTLYENGTAQFKVSVTNTGGEYLDSYIGIYMQNQSNGAMSDFVAVDKYFIGTNETKDLILTGTIPAEFVVSSNEGDDYFVALMYDPTNSGSSSLKAADLTSDKVKKAPVVNKVSMELASALSFPDKNNVTPNTFKLKVHLKNTGDYFDGEVAVLYNTEGISYRVYDSQFVMMEPNEEKIIYFTQAPPVAFGTQQLGTYFFHSLDRNWLEYGNASILQYIFKDDVTVGVEEEQLKSVGNVNVYPNPATDYVSFESDEVVKSVRVISLTGQVVVNAVPMASGVITIPVSNISAGTYIIQVETDADIRTSKFVKK